jgi:hypothetical protein
MLIRSHWLLRAVLSSVVWMLAACNLSTQPPITPTELAVILTNTPTATPSATPTLTPPPVPTATSLPPVTPAYRVSNPVPGPVCSLSPTVDAANIRSGPSTVNPVLGVLPAGNWVRARLQDSVTGWYQVTFTGSVVDNGWISNTVVTLQQPCVCGPNNCTAVTTPVVTATVPPPADWCAMSVLTTADLATIHAQPSTSSSITGQLTYGSFVNTIGRTLDGVWYAIDPGISQASNVGIYRLRWVRADSRINLSGVRCGLLKTIDLTAPPAFKTCVATPAPGVVSIPVYNQSGYDAGTWGTLVSGQSLPIAGKTPINWFGSAGGWYAVIVNPGIVPDVGRYALRWIAIDPNVQQTGDCTDLPTVTLDF